MSELLMFIGNLNLGTFFLIWMSTIFLVIFLEVCKQSCLHILFPKTQDLKPIKLSTRASLEVVYY